MRIARIIAVLICLGALSSCSVNYIYPNRNAVFSDQLNDDNSGLVIGRVTLKSWYGARALLFGERDGRGISFVDLESQKKTVYVHGNYFFLRLPIGKYLFQGIGEPAGLIVPIGDGFTFLVEKSKVKYIGSFLSAADLTGDSVVISSKEYGVHPKEAMKFYVVDEREKIIAQFLERFPEYKGTEVVIDFMK